MTTMKQSSLSIILSLLLAQPVLPQQEPSAAPSKGIAKFSTTRQLVVVDVTAKDKSGKPIKNLKPADFAITEDGKKQDIEVFQYQELEESLAPEPVPALKKRDDAKDEAPAGPAAPVVKSLTANQIAAA